VSILDLSLIEERIVFLRAQGRATEEIATDLGLDQVTVAWHLSRASRKLEQAVALHGQVASQSRDGEAERRKLK
jgi:DNA-directed RNA polymerase specialized sigma24 family protein